MLNLIFKDIILSKRTFLTVVLTYLMLNLIYSKALTITYILMPAIIMYLLVDESTFYDYRHNVNVMFSSLPVRRRDVVISKYIGAATFFVIGIAITMIFTNLFESIGYSSDFFKMLNINMGTFNKLMGTGSIIESWAVSCIFFIGIYFPAYFKYKYTKVRGIFMLVYVFIIAMPIIFIKVIGSVNTYKFITYFSKVPEWIIGVGTIIALILILSISLNLSIRFYEKKDL